MNQRRITAAIAGTVAVLALLGAAACLYAMRHGAGTSPDAVLYLEAAGNLATQGRLIVEHPGGIGLLQWLPPGFSVLLAGLHTFAGDALRASPWLLFVLAAFGIALWAMVGAMAAHQRAGAITAAAFMACSGVMLGTFTWCLSEALFLPLLGAACFTLQRLLTGATWRRALVLGLLAGALCVTRFAGLFLPAAAFFLILLWGSGGLGKRALMALAVLALGVGPLGLWKYSVSGDTTSPHRTWGFYEPTVEQLEEAAITTAALFLPSAGDDTQQMAGTAFLPVLLLTGLVLAFIGGRLRQNVVGARELLLLPVLAWGYLVFVVAARLFYDAGIRFDMRMLSPMLFLLMAALAAALHRGLLAPRWAGRVVSAALLLGLLIPHAWASWHEVQRSHTDGIGYARAMWTDSQMLSLLRTLEPDATLYANIPEISRLYLGRRARPLPRTHQMSTGEANPRLRTELRDVQARLQSDGGVVAYFSLPRSRTPALKDLRDAIRGRVLYEGPEGVILTARDARPRLRTAPATAPAGPGSGRR